MAASTVAGPSSVPPAAQGGGSDIVGSKAGITAVVMVAAVMAMIDITIVNVALSDIRASFGTPLDQIGWVSTGYMMANIVIIPMTGWFQRRFGYKRYFAASVALFTVASLLCGLSWNLPSLVLFRVLQGLGGGAIIPTAQSILFARYPKHQHGMASGLFGLAAITGPLLGPSIGGYLIDWFSWHWIFMVNLPIGIIACILAFRFIDQPGFEPPKGEEAKIDKWGIGLLAVGMPTLQYTVEEGNRDGWFESPRIIMLSLIAGVSLITFVVHELEVKHPVVDLRVFKNRSYVAGTGINFLTGFALFSGSYLFSLYAGAVIHYTALEIGRVFLVAGSVSVVLMPLVGKLAPKFDSRILLAFGLAVVTYSQYTASKLTGDAGFWNMVAPNMIRSAGLGFVFIPVTMVALSDLAPAQRGNATGLFNLTRELGGSLGTAFMGMAVTDGIKRNASYLAEHVNVYDPRTQEQLAGTMGGVGARTFTTDHLGETILQFKVMTQAMVLSFEHGFRLVAFSISLGFLLIFLVKKPRADVKVEAH